MRQTDLYRSGKPPELLSRNCFELLVKSIAAFVTLLASRFLDWVQRARWCTQSRSRHRRPEAEPRYDLDRRRWQLEAAVTAPDYRLYALPMPGSSWLLCNGGAPPRTPDQQVLDHPIIANGPIAPLVTMTCRLLPHRVASRGVLPRERFRCYGLRGEAVAPSSRQQSDGAPHGESERFEQMPCHP